MRTDDSDVPADDELHDRCDEILKTIDLPHYFGCAFDRDQVHRYLPLKLNSDAFEEALRQLTEDGLVCEKGARLYAQEVEGDPERKRAWSRELFKRHERSLRLLCRLPWVRFMGLTGANAFESCRQTDDLDLFVVTAPNRLWLTFLAMIAFSRAAGQRDILCINYLVDEDHLPITHQSYYTAVQLMSMVPLVDRGLGDRLIDANRWVFRYLPNAPAELNGNRFYMIDDSAEKPSSVQSQFLTAMNRHAYLFYSRRLRRMYPEAFGAGIVVSEGAARLHRIDYGGLYDKISAERSGRQPPG